jgi:hypothetical protein
LSAAPSRTAPAAAGCVGCTIAGHGVRQIAARDIAALRQQPLPLPAARLGATFLKHTDEQTLVGLAALGQAVESTGRDVGEFRDWGVLAAPRFLGRSALVESLERYRDEGAWGISPHFIPHRSLHSVSGTVSQALGIRGPNFGVGGGPGAATEAFTVAAALLADASLPGLWMILSGFEPIDTPQSPLMCTAIALALVPATPDLDGLRLELGRDQPASQTDAERSNRQPRFRLDSFAGALTSESFDMAWDLGNEGWVRLVRARYRMRDCA